MILLKICFISVYLQTSSNVGDNRLLSTEEMDR